ncbi:MAG: hypothetical protein EA343_02810 [Nodularia sp. (in: Bacteria)]|nr:MAG: hypothetical protein EA343_02810 [Nodularia sp. (in: cyanobacteria)]
MGYCVASILQKPFAAKNYRLVLGDIGTQSVFGCCLISYAVMIATGVATCQHIYKTKDSLGKRSENNSYLMTPIYLCLLLSLELPSEYHRRK